LTTWSKYENRENVTRMPRRREFLSAAMRATLPSHSVTSDASVVLVAYVGGNRRTPGARHGGAIDHQSWPTRRR